MGQTARTVKERLGIFPLSLRGSVTTAAIQFYLALLFTGSPRYARDDKGRIKIIPPLTLTTCPLKIPQAGDLLFI